MEYNIAKAEIDVLDRLYQMPATPPELYASMKYTRRQLEWVLQRLREADLVRRVQGTNLMMVIDL